MNKRKAKRTIRRQRHLLAFYRDRIRGLLDERDLNKPVSFSVLEIRLGENTNGRPMILSIPVDPSLPRQRTVDLPALGYDVTQRDAPEDLDDFVSFAFIGGPAFDKMFPQPKPTPDPYTDAPSRFDMRDPATRMREHDETLMQTYERMTAEIVADERRSAAGPEIPSAVDPLADVRRFVDPEC